MTVLRPGYASSLDWNLLKVFYEIAMARGISAAAIKLSRRQSTISHSLNRLETGLDVILCFRGPAGFELTDEGQILYEYCLDFFKQIDDIPNSLSNVAEEVRGTLKFEIISNIVCPRLDEIFHNYNQNFPFVNLEIDIVPWEGIPKSILRNHVDIGIAPANTRHPELKYDLLFKENHRVFCGKSHHLYGHTINDVNELASENFVLTGNDEPEQLTRFRMRNNLGNHTSGTSSHLEEAKRLTLIGAGICFLPEGFNELEIENGQLWSITPVLEELTLEIFIITHTQVPKRLARQFFLDEVLKSSCPA